MTHLGRWLSALVDGELDDIERDRILNHLARCLPCRLEANELRALKRRVNEFGGAPDPAADQAADLAVTGRLLGFTRTGADGIRHMAVQAPRSRLGGPAWLRASGSAGAVIAAVGLTAFLLGGTPAAPEPKVTPAVDTYWLQHSYDTGQVPAVAPHPGAYSSPASGGSGGRGQGSHLRKTRPRAVSALLPAVSATATPPPVIVGRHQS